MRARRLPTFLRVARLFLVAPLALVGLPLFTACSGAGASYPDRGDVASAQVGWCNALAKPRGGDAWDGMAACKADYPTASSPFLRAMTKCFNNRRDALGDKPYDDAQIAGDCKDEVLFKLPGDDHSGDDVIAARCRWTERCAKVPMAECKAAVAKLESVQRAIFTTVYNGAARQTIITCLDDAACIADEDAAKEACYKAPSEKLLYFPH